MNPQQFTILIVDDESDITELLQDILEDEGYQVLTAANAEEADQFYLDQPIDLVLLDIWMPKEDGLSLLTRWCENGLNTQVIMMSGHGTIETAVQATKLGAFDFIEKPISIAKILITIENVFKKIKLEQRNKALMRQINPSVQIIGKSTIITGLKEKIEQVKDTPLPVCFIGQSGVGKTYYARYLHQLSERQNMPFIIVNASSLSRVNQIDEIFGSHRQEGLLQTAEEGTLFIDEIADLEKNTQELFAQLLENKHCRIPGQNYSVSLQARLCFSSQHDLSALVSQDELSENLFFQIQPLNIKVPALMEYKDDIPEMINYYVYQFVDYDNLPYRHFSMQALNYLRQYDWPGNVRELRNFVQRVLVLSKNEEISLPEVEELIDLSAASDDKEEPISIDLPIRDAREQFEKAYFMKQLSFCEGNIAKLAERAGLERTNLYRKLKSLGIQYK